jgi:colanic acid biosynthesis protein WcaH
VVRSAPLVSLDLIARNPKGQVLLGKRRNAPARDYWFAPGGRILKNERLDRALLRISVEELGLPLAPADVQLLGLFDHIYPDNVFGREGFGTHYVTLALELRATDRAPRVDPGQHTEQRWFDLPELLADPWVHPYTKSYFDHRQKNRFRV